MGGKAFIKTVLNAALHLRDKSLASPTDDVPKNDPCLYEYRQYLGSGAYGAVFLYRHRPDGRLFAIKEVQVYTDIRKKTLEREVQALESIQHPNVVRLYGVHTHPSGTHCLIMEYAEGGDLQRFIRLRRKNMKLFKSQSFLLSEGLVRSYLYQLASALAHCHSPIHSSKTGHEGEIVLHRDIKPANILIGRQGQLKLADFGLARMTPHHVPVSSGGTASYMAPEVCNAEKDTTPYTTASDMWSLGCVVYELCTLRRLVPSKDGLVCKNEITKTMCVDGIISEASAEPAAQLLPVMYSSWLTGTVRALLSPSPDERPTAQDILDTREMVYMGHLLRKYPDGLPAGHL